MMLSSTVPSAMGTRLMPAARHCSGVAPAVKMASRVQLRSSQQAKFTINRRQTRSERAVVVRTAAIAAPDTSTVKVVIQGINVEITPAIRQHVEDKVQKVVSHFEAAVKEVDVKVSVRPKDGAKREKGHHVQSTEIVVYTKKHGVVRVADQEDNLYASIDLVTDKLQRKLRKIKEKSVNKGTWTGRGGPKGGTVITEVLSTTETVDTLPTDQVAKLPAEVVKTKVFFLDAMTLDDALEQIENVGHDFYVFREANSDEVQILYKRRHHGYGIIVPKSLAKKA